MSGVSGHGAIAAEIARRNGLLDRNTKTMLNRIGRVAQSTARDLAPVGATGNYRKSLKARTAWPTAYGIWQVKIRAARHGYLVEEGRTAGKMPGPEDLVVIARWARKKLGVAGDLDSVKNPHERGTSEARAFNRGRRTAKAAARQDLRAVSFLLARSFARHGTKGHKVMARTQRAIEGDVRRIAAEGGARLLRGGR